MDNRERQATLISPSRLASSRDWKKRASADSWTIVVWLDSYPIRVAAYSALVRNWEMQMRNGGFEASDKFIDIHSRSTRARCVNEIVCFCFLNGFIRSRVCFWVALAPTTLFQHSFISTVYSGRVSHKSKHKFLLISSAARGRPLTRR